MIALLNGGVPLLATGATSMTQVQFRVPGVPVAKGRGRIVTVLGHGAIKTPQKTRDYESWVAYEARKAMGNWPLLTGPLMMRLDFWLPIPASWSGKRKAAAATGAWHTSKPDLSNAWKAIEDACNGIVYADDATLCQATCTKRYGVTPGVDVLVCTVALL